MTFFYFQSFKVICISWFNFKWIADRKVTWSISWTLHFIHHCSFLHLRPWQSGVCYISYVSITVQLIFLCSLFINPEDVAPLCKCLLIRQLLFSMKFYTPSLFVPQSGKALFLPLYSFMSTQYQLRFSLEVTNSICFPYESYFVICGLRRKVVIYLDICTLYTVKTIGRIKDFCHLIWLIFFFQYN